MKKILLIALIGASMPAVAMKNDTADQFYTDLRRFTDFAEGHPAVPEAAGDIGMVATANYVEGLWDGILLARLMARKDISCAPQSIPNLALARTVLVYIDAHPSSRTMTGALVTTNAFLDAYPCLKERKM